MIKFMILPVKTLLDSLFGYVIGIMRYLQILLSEDKRDAILRELENNSVDYVVTEETGHGGNSSVVSFALPKNAVEPVLNRLRRVGLNKDAFTIILKPEIVNARHFKDLLGLHKKKEIAQSELKARAEEMAPSLSTFLIMTAISAIIATTGLLTNSAAVIIGAMVIAPLMGPAMATSVGTVVSDTKLFLRGIKLQAIGVVVAIISAAAFALVVKQASLIPFGLNITTIPEVRSRLIPDVLSLFIALGSGIAAAISLSRGVSSVLVGAMIAVALVPPAATVGLGMVWGIPLVMLGAGVLLLVNLLAMNIVSLLVFWYLGYRPENIVQSKSARISTLRRVGALIVMLAFLSIILASVTYVSYESAAFEERVKKEAKEFFKQPSQKKYQLLETKIQFRIVDVIFFGEVPKVILLVAKDKNVQQPELAKQLDSYLSKKADYPVDVQLRFLEVAESRSK